MITTGPPWSTQVACDQNASECMQSGCEKCPLLTEIDITMNVVIHDVTGINGHCVMEELKNRSLLVTYNAAFSFVQA